MLKLQYFGHLIQRSDSLEKTLMLGNIECRRRRKLQRTRCLDGITDSMDMSLNKFGRKGRTGKPGMLQSMGLRRVGHSLATEQQYELDCYNFIMCTFQIKTNQLRVNTLKTISIRLGHGYYPPTIATPGPATKQVDASPFPLKWCKLDSSTSAYPAFPFLSYRNHNKLFCFDPAPPFASWQILVFHWDPFLWHDTPPSIGNFA